MSTLNTQPRHYFMDDDQIFGGIRAAFRTAGQINQAYKTAKLAGELAYAGGSYIDRRLRELTTEEPQSGVTKLEYQQDPYHISKRKRSLRYQIEAQPTYKHYYQPTNKVYDFKMPKYGRRRFTRRRRAFRRYPRKMVTRRMPPTIQRRAFASTGVGFPKRLKMTHRWTTNTTITCTTGALSGAQVKANSMYAPGDSFSVATDPMYYDQMTALYDHWVVIGSKIKVTLVPNSTSTAYVRWGIYLNDDSTLTPATIEGCCTQSGAVSKTTNSTATAQESVLVKKYSAKKEFGGSVMANSVLRGTDAANPSEVQYYTIFAKPVDSASSLGYTVVIEVEYVAIWLEPHDISMS